MIRSNAFNYINILDKAADASWIRNEVIANNIANVDTPNFKRSDVDFQSILEQELSGSDTLDKKIANVELERLNVDIKEDYSNLSYRLDGNNVDIDIESANLAENQIRYNTLVDAMSQEFNRLKMVLSKL